VITIVHLYPRELGINGDVGNVLALRRRAEWRGLETRLVEVGAGEDLPGTAHLVHIGSGPASARLPLHTDLERQAATLQDWAEAGVPFLAIAAGWQLLGRAVTEADGTISPGAGVLPSSARVSATRVVGEVAGESDLGEIAGFVNYGAEYTVDAGVAPFARLAGGVLAGSTDGLVSGRLVATNLHGPVLPMNPVWADRLLDAAAELSGDTGREPHARRAEVDDYARRSRDAIRARLGLPVLPR
jgi:CobQ-like glutamine amidotransferase family enzyme